MTFSYIVNDIDNVSPLEPLFWLRQSVSTKRCHVQIGLLLRIVANMLLLHLKTSFLSETYGNILLIYLNSFL